MIQLISFGKAEHLRVGKAPGIRVGRYAGKGCGAVSYTHLKESVVSRFTFYLCVESGGSHCVPVSYTHLQGVTLEHLRSVPKMNNAELRRFKLT